MKSGNNTGEDAIMSLPDEEIPAPPRRQASSSPGGAESQRTPPSTGKTNDASGNVTLDIKKRKDRDMESSEGLPWGTALGTMGFPSDLESAAERHPARSELHFQSDMETTNSSLRREQSNLHQEYDICRMGHHSSGDDTATSSNNSIVATTASCFSRPDNRSYDHKLKEDSEQESRRDHPLYELLHCSAMRALAQSERHEILLDIHGVSDLQLQEQETSYFLLEQLVCWDVEVLRFSFTAANAGLTGDTVEEDAVDESQLNFASYLAAAPGNKSDKTPVKKRDDIFPSSSASDFPALGKSFIIPFLRVTRYDSVKAVERLSRYLRWRQEKFFRGEETSSLSSGEITKNLTPLGVILAEEEMPSTQPPPLVFSDKELDLLKSGFFQVLPSRDRSGRTILWVSVSPLFDRLSSFSSQSSTDSSSLPASPPWSSQLKIATSRQQKEDEEQYGKTAEANDGKKAAGDTSRSKTPFAPSANSSNLATAKVRKHLWGHI